MFPDFESCSGRLYRRACETLPGGNTRTSVYWPPHQIYAVSGHGSHIIDEDGVERIDLQNNFTTLIHGHSHPKIVAAVREQIERLMSVGMTTRREIELAEIIVGRVKTIEQIRFCNSGTEAVEATIKAARAYTMRPKIAKCEGLYHGSSAAMEISVASPPGQWGDATRPASLPMSRGTPKSIIDEILVLPFNDTEAARSLLEAHAEDLAGVVVDPMPVRAGMVEATPEFLAMLRDFTRRSGSVLIFDEVLNFRLGYHGAQARFGCEPDLTALGKIIGGGLPIGAVGGRAEILALFDPTKGYAVWHGGTFNGNPTSMAAGIASMELLTEEAFSQLEALGDLARRRIEEAFAAAGVPGRVTGLGSLLRIHCTGKPMHDYRSFYPSPDEARMLDWLMTWLLNNGFLMTRMGTAAISTANTAEEIELMAATLHEGLEAYKRQSAAA
jgi:glutamate-1-semialdehyde 2,1-aminomutase